MDKVFIEQKLACAVNQAKVRGLRISTSWNLVGRNGAYAFNGSGNIYILSFFVEGRSLYIDKDVLAAKALRIDSENVPYFHNSFCGNEEYPQVKSDEIMYIHNMGIKYRKLVGL